MAEGRISKLPTEETLRSQELILHTLGFEVHLRHRVEELGEHVSGGTQIWAQVKVSTARRELLCGECTEGR